MSDMVVVNSASKKRLSFKAQTAAAILSVVAAVVVPQIFHVIGAVSGLGTALGETFLPMHLPIILTGLLAGPYAGAVSGLLGPLASYLLSGMPRIAMLPFMMVELAVYGLVAGLLRNVKMPVIGKVVITQVAGRVIRAAAILLAVYVFGNETVRVSAILSSIKTGLPGIILQWCLLPLIVFWVDNRAKDEQ